MKSKDGGGHRAHIDADQSRCGESFLATGPTFLLGLFFGDFLALVGEFKVDTNESQLWEEVLPSRVCCITRLAFPLSKLRKYQSD